MKNLLFMLTILCSIGSADIIAQPIETRLITGRVVDEHQQPILFANVLTQPLSTGIMTDINGWFSLRIPASSDTLKIIYTGYEEKILTPIPVQDSILIIMNGGMLLDAAVVTAYKVAPVEQNNTTQGGSKTAEQIRNLPTKSVNAIVATTAGAIKTDGSEINIRGSRTNATNYYLDAVRMVNHGKQPQTMHGAAIPTEYQTEDYSLIVENSFHAPVKDPLSTFSIDVDVASYANMRRFLVSGQRPPKDAVRLEELVNYFDYNYPQPTTNVPFSIITESGECPWEPKHKLVHIGIQGKQIATKNLLASNLVFLIDVSGSMQDENKLPLVISSFKILADQLRQIDKVAIVVYAGSSGLVLPSTSGANKNAIIEALEKLRAGGSTAGAAGIQLAYNVARENFIKGGNNRVILATDGDFNVGVSSDADLVRLIEKERESGVFLTVLGFGTGNYMDNKMQELADHGNGNHGYVDNLSEAKKVFVNEFGGTLFTIAKDVKIQVEFNPEQVEGYRLIGYENRMLESEDFNDDKKDAGEIGSDQTVTALYEIIPAGTSSHMLKSIDPLTYQKVRDAHNSSNDTELMTVKIRYKEPEGVTSKLIQKVVLDQKGSFASTSENFRWSAAVASFGMLLRESEFKGNSTYEDVELWATGAKGKDTFGYRQEFIQLVRGIHNVLEGSAER